MTAHDRHAAVAARHYHLRHFHPLGEHQPAMLVNGAAARPAARHQLFEIACLVITQFDERSVDRQTLRRHANHRSEERSVGTGGVSQGIMWWELVRKNKKQTNQSNKIT